MNNRHKQTNIDELVINVGKAPDDNPKKVAIITSTIREFKNIVANLKDRKDTSFIHISKADNIKSVRFDEVIEHYSMIYEVEELNRIQNMISKRLNKNAVIYYLGRTGVLKSNKNIINQYIKN